MTADNERPSPMSIEIEAELRQRLEAAADAHNLSTRDVIAATLRVAIEEHGGAEQPSTDDEWRQLSVSAFARDWDSDADAVYDSLTIGNCGKLPFSS